MKKFTTEEIRDLFNKVMADRMRFSRMVEVINERVSEAEVSEYKDGDFVVNVFGFIIIFKNKVEDSIYDHAYFSESVGVVVFSNTPSTISIKRHATEEEKQKMLDELAKEGKRWNEEKKCVEDIPKRRFKNGDKVRIKKGISSKTHYDISPGFVGDMDDLIGKTMTVSRYTHECGYVVCNENYRRFHEDWLEPYVEELKAGDLAIFWDYNKGSAFIGEYDYFIRGVDFPHKDKMGNVWANAVKFESVEQYRKLLKGEI